MTADQYDVNQQFQALYQHSVRAHALKVLVQALHPDATLADVLAGLHFLQEKSVDLNVLQVFDLLHGRALRDVPPMRAAEKPARPRAPAPPQDARAGGDAPLPSEATARCLSLIVSKLVSERQPKTTEEIHRFLKPLEPSVSLAHVEFMLAKLRHEGRIVPHEKARRGWMFYPQGATSSPPLVIRKANAASEAT